MKFRKDNPAESGTETRLTSSDEMRELAEAVSLYGSAMRHVAEKQVARPFVRAERRATGLRMRLVLVPALGAALAAAVIGPAVSHLHHASTAAIKTTRIEDPPASATAVAKVDDTQLMNQIDSDLTADVPDALQPLTGWDDTSATVAKSSGTEK
jgi:hypothetical protein